MGRGAIFEGSRISISALSLEGGHYRNADLAQACCGIDPNQCRANEFMPDLYAGTQ